MIRVTNTQPCKRVESILIFAGARREQFDMEAEGERVVLWCVSCEYFYSVKNFSVGDQCLLLGPDSTTTVNKLRQKKQHDGVHRPLQPVTNLVRYRSGQPCLPTPEISHASLGVLAEPLDDQIQRMHGPFLHLLSEAPVVLSIGRENTYTTANGRRA